MATIYRIEQTGPRRLGTSTSELTPVSAEIILFPGVRYERWTEAQDATQPTKRSARRRDRLDIAE